MEFPERMLEFLKCKFLIHFSTSFDSKLDLDGVKAPENRRPMDESNEPLSLSCLEGVVKVDIIYKKPFSQSAA